MRSDPFARVAAKAGFETGIVAAKGHRLRFYRRAAKTGGTVELVTVYLEGDGSPWATVNRVATDPTTRDPVALRLMAQDAGDVLYLARPCYHALDREGCDARLWTRDRYSREIVDAMAEALQQLAPVPARIRLVGFSGGGALAAQLASRIDRVDTLVTLAGNLDIEAWASRHDYSPLHGSMNPAVLGVMPERIAQFHLFGDRDKNVPVDIAKRFLQRQGNAKVAVLADFDHRCCWEDIWPKVLQAITRRDRFCAVLSELDAVSVCGLAAP